MLLSHWLGLIGEGLNFFGALVLALDIFLRKQERILKRKLDDLADVARINGLETTIYNGYSLASPDFAENVLHRRSTMAAYTGVTLLALGFLFLAAYHSLEIRELHQKSAFCVPMNMEYETIFRKSDTHPSGAHLMAATTFPTVERIGAVKPVLTRIAGKFQITVPPEIREIYGLREGDLLEWHFEEQTSQLVLYPKRAQLITPQVEKEMDAVFLRRAKAKRSALAGPVAG